MVAPSSPETRARASRVRELAGELQARVAPVTEAGERLLAVPEPLRPLFPGGGLQRGWSVGVGGTGGWSLGMALAGAALTSDGWAAAIGLEELGLVAAGELGLPLSRLLLVGSPGSQHRATAVATLIEAVDVVLLGSGPGMSFTPREARRLSARAREQETVLLHLDGGRNWPQGLDASLTAEPVFAGRASGTGGAWSGVDGSGHGYLRSRPVVVSTSGRRSMARPRRVEILLPGPDGGLAPSPTAGTEPGAGVREAVGSSGDPNRSGTVLVSRVAG